MLQNFVRKYHNWKNYSNTCAELSRLSNRELDDLGIARCDIKSIARQKHFDI